MTNSILIAAMPVTAVQCVSVMAAQSLPPLGGRENNMFETLLRHYRFKQKDNACLFAESISHLKPTSLQIKKGLPEYKGQANTGWAVYVKCRSIADELVVSNTFKAVADCYKMEGFYY